MPPAVIDLLLFLYTAARRRNATAHGLMQQVHILRSNLQGDSESPLLYALILEPQLRTKGHRLRSAGEAERGLTQAHIATCW